jgi:hypothetical protein
VQRRIFRQIDNTHTAATDLFEQGVSGAFEIGEFRNFAQTRKG